MTGNVGIGGLRSSMWSLFRSNVCDFTFAGVDKNLDGMWVVHFIKTCPSVDVISLTARQIFFFALGGSS